MYQPCFWGYWYQEYDY